MKGHTSARRLNDGLKVVTFGSITQNLKLDLGMGLLNHPDCFNKSLQVVASAQGAGIRDPDLSRRFINQNGVLGHTGIKLGKLVADVHDFIGNTRTCIAHTTVAVLLRRAHNGIGQLIRRLSLLVKRGKEDVRKDRNIQSKRGKPRATGH